MSEWTLLLPLASTLMSTLSGLLQLLSRYPAIVSGALTINWPNSPNPKKTAFEEFVIAVVWNCTTKWICNHSVLARQVLILSGEGGDLKWWDAVITMARSMCRQRNKNTKCPIDAHCHRHCRRDPRLHWCQNPAEHLLASMLKITGSKTWARIPGGQEEAWGDLQRIWKLVGR